MGMIGVDDVIVARTREISRSLAISSPRSAWMRVLQGKWRRPVGGASSLWLARRSLAWGHNRERGTDSRAARNVDERDTPQSGALLVPSVRGAVLARVHGTRGTCSRVHHVCKCNMDDKESAGPASGGGALV